MTVTISNGIDSVSPALVDGFRAARTSRNVLVPILNASSRAVSLRPAGLLTGTLRLFFLNHADAVECLALLAAPGIFTYENTTDSAYDMTFVVPPGELTIELDDTTRLRWWIDAPFEEITL
jgi:hypothetical protein